MLSYLNLDFFPLWIYFKVIVYILTLFLGHTHAPIPPVRSSVFKHISYHICNFVYAYVYIILFPWAIKTWLQNLKWLTFKMSPTIIEKLLQLLATGVRENGISSVMWPLIGCCGCSTPILITVVLVRISEFKWECHEIKREAIRGNSGRS